MQRSKKITPEATVQEITIQGPFFVYKNYKVLDGKLVEISFEEAASNMVKWGIAHPVE